MSHFAGIICQEPRDDLLNQMEKMLCVMDLPNLSIGSFVDSTPYAAFGMTKQPFSKGSNENFIVGFSGTLHNINAIKLKLIDHGQILEQETQTEILILAYQTWGPDFIEALDGSFVFFLYHKKEKKLFLGRDKLGSHRIYWGQFGNIFIFATALKGVLSTKFVPQRPCLDSIASYFYLGYFPQDKTPIANLNSLLPAYYLQVNRDIQVIVDKYWSFKTQNISSEANSPDEVAKKLDDLLQRAIEKRNPEKKPMHCFMQGDIGSTSIAYYAKKLCPDGTFGHSLDFEGLSSSYLPVVESLSQTLQIPLDQSQINSSLLLDNLSQMVWNLDEPISDPNSVLIWNLAQKLKGKTHSLYCSLGAKEFLGIHLGNTSLGYEPLLLWFLELLSPLVLRLGVPLLSKINKSYAFNALRFFQSDFWALEYIKQNSFFKVKELKKIAPALYKRFDFATYIQQTYQYLKYIHSQNFDLNDYLSYDAEMTLSNYLLVQYQNLMRSADINVINPFLDQDVFQFLLHTPEHLKSRRNNQAIPLQKILSPVLSKHQLAYDYQRDLHSMDASNWNKEIQNLVKILSRGTLCESGLISQRGFIQEYTKGGKGCLKFRNLWSILILEIWFKLFVNRPVYSYPNSGSLVEYLQKS
jgi:asparagine synthase (glutamine-hydrolysing)